MSSDEDLLQSVKIVLVEKCKLEKQNKALGERVLQLQVDKGKLIDENRKLRCCGNCKNNFSCHYESIDELARIDCGKDLKSWELKE